jgi:phosphatidylglycerophosphate synthase
MATLPVALYVPNVICYARIILALVGLWYSLSRPVVAVVLWAASAITDLLDGPLARALGQTSNFGVFLDITADNILRSCVWIAASLAVALSSASNDDADRVIRSTSFHVVCFTMILIVEWVTMVVHATAHGGEKWKDAKSRGDPWLVQTYFANNFKNPLGILGMYGMFSANIFCYASVHPILYDNFPFFRTWKLLAFAGRLVSLLIEVWFCIRFARFTVELEASRPAPDSTKSRCA